MTARTATGKAFLREAALARRDGLSPGARAAACAQLVRRCEVVLAGLSFSSLSGFLPIRSECDLRPVMAFAAARGAVLALPAFLDRQTMVFRRYAEGDPLVPAGFGTREPAASAPAVDPDVLLVPLAGFDRAGGRLGYGKGHYDRTISAMQARGLRPLLVGVAFAVQEVDPIPVEAHDVRLDFVVTEGEVLDFR